MKMLLRFLTCLILLGNTFVHAQTAEKYTVEFLFAFPENDILGVELSQPQAISIDANGNVFVVDTGNNRIIKFDSKGKIITSQGGFGWGKEQFDKPLDISVKSVLDVFIADYNNQRIERYDKDLHYISSLVAEESNTQELQFGFPLSVGISKHGELFLSDAESNRILKLDSFGNPLLSFGDFNWGEGKLDYPVKVEISNDDLIYVADQTANDIVIFDYYGNFVLRFGKTDLLNAPAGLALGRKEIYVADTGNNRIVVFDKQYQKIFTWGSKGSRYGAFDSPVDLDLYNDLVYVLDSLNKRVQVFELSNSN